MEFSLCSFILSVSIWLSAYKVGDGVWWRGENNEHQQAYIQKVYPGGRYLIYYIVSTRRVTAIGEVVYETSSLTKVVNRGDLRDQVFQF